MEILLVLTITVSYSILQTVVVFSDDHRKTIRYDRLCICSGAIPNVSLTIFR